MTMEKAVTFAIGLVAGYYIVAHFKRTGKAV
jgi:hypothetical protein